MARGRKGGGAGSAEGSRVRSDPELKKTRTGIAGFDQITGGGLPQGRPTLICGGPGCGKTLFSIEFLVRGATELGEPGVFLAFEENVEDLYKNVSSLGFDLGRLVRDKLLAIDYVRVERSEIEETGEYDLDGLFIRLGYAIDSIGAKRVVLDTIESLFSGLSNTAILRAELRRLFAWLKDKGVTAIITGERGEGSLTREGLEEYISDCVVLLENRVVSGVSTRQLRIVKYRGSGHGGNEYPFLIDEQGFSILPVTSLGLEHTVSDERISTGVPQLDHMLGGGGYYRGSSVLVTGTAGSGKTSLAAHFALASCRRGEKCLYFTFEESPLQLMRNMRSIGVGLEPWEKKGLLQFHAIRSTSCGLEMLLVMMHKAISTGKPKAVVIDPLTNVLQAGAPGDAKATLLRIIDYLKEQGVTAVCTSLTSGGAAAEGTSEHVSSLMDTWLLLRNLESGGERNRGLYVLKSRGMAHSNQVREFVLTNHGVELVDAYTGPNGVLMGTARVAQEAAERAAELERGNAMRELERRVERKQATLRAQITTLENELEDARDELKRAQEVDAERKGSVSALRGALARRRGADEDARPKPARPKKRNSGEVRS